VTEGEITVKNTALPDGTVNKPYSPTTILATGGTPPLKWSVAPALPPDLSLDTDKGVVSGTPKAVSPKN
jgi:hypothetical protein